MFSTLLVAIFGALVAFYWPGIHSSLFGSSPPVSIEVQSNPSQVPSPAARLYVLPLASSDIRLPKHLDGTYAVDEWAWGRGAIPTDDIYRLTLTANSNANVVVESFHVKILSESRALSGTAVSSVPGAGPLSVPTVSINLGGNPPVIRYGYPPGQGPTNEAPTQFAYSLQPGESVVFQIDAESPTYVRWRLTMQLDVGGHQVSYDLNELTNDNQPFQVTGACHARYFYFDTTWKPASSPPCTAYPSLIPNS